MVNTISSGSFVGVLVFSTTGGAVGGAVGVGLHPTMMIPAIHKKRRYLEIILLDECAIMNTPPLKIT